MQQENEVEPEKGLSKTKSDNLYLTFAFLVEAFSESAPKYKGPNVATIAAHLESLALAANSKETLSGQKTEAIKDRIEAAMSTKRKTLPNSAK
jgi:isocitrate/isopropylmalate dehydrogenase